MIAVSLTWKLCTSAVDIRTCAEIKKIKIFFSPYLTEEQTISNWENDKNYPDIKSLVLMSEVFQVSLDNLIKGDLEKMKKEIDAQEFEKFQKDGNVFTVLFIILLIAPVPLVLLWKWAGLAIYLALFGITMIYAVRIEKYKKKYDIQTYKEIVAFTDGKSLDEIEKTREEAKRPYQKVLLAAGAGLLVVVIAVIMTAVMKWFM
ncbi:MAG: helix-turn-helix transcriptional regulator [Bacteroidales bacterium]|nr:helix-turn-helix transcriptional regulator [Bacteroidales bacterium]